MARRSRQTGFTLLEVLVAMAVIAVAMAAVIRGTGMSASNAVYLKERTIGHWVAMNRVAELQLQAEWPSVGVTNGRTEMVSHEWRWETKISETEDKDVRRIDVKAFAGAQDENPIAALVAYVDKPD